MKIKLSILLAAVALTVLSACSSVAPVSVDPMSGLESALRKDIENSGATVSRLSDDELKVMIPSSVLFDFDSFAIKPGFSTFIQKIAATLVANENVKVGVNGYTDNVGTSDYNQKLSERRAAGVSDQLTKNNVAANRLVAKGYGMTDPVADNASADGRAKNRRVELVIRR